jgi:hypothetical protein
MKYYILFLIVVFGIQPIKSQKMWDTSSYPDETGFQHRMEGMLQKIAAKDFGKRSLAVSKCPDTGLPVKVWAVESEEIISPYTGRKYIQGPTGYFGPKSRNQKGEILSFGGDPLKYDLPPATAILLLNPEDQRTKAFLSIPGNLRQQYHFACKNWARFYPLLADKMGEEWKSELIKYVAEYTEGRRPSDGPARELKPLANAHNLVGQPGYLLGGNPLDGGTENHKTMWRTSALLYSQLFPDTAKISGYPAEEAEKLTKEMLRDYLKGLLATGNGEYDSQIYYPHSIEGFLNLYDFSPDEETRELAKFALDYYFVTYGLKVIDGTIAGAQKRGYLAGSSSSEMETMLWAFFNNTSRNMENESVTIQQATTSYRPNQVICNIVNKKLKFPFDAKMSRPFYHMDHPHAFAETYYCSDNYAMGNIQMTIVDNPNQQMVWSVVTNGKNMPLCFSGGQPLRGSTSGHSPYTQTLQSKGTLILMTAPTEFVPNTDTLLAPNYSKAKRENLWLLPESEQGRNFETRNRMKYASKELHTLQKPKSDSAKEVERFWNESKGSASSWFYFPRNLKVLERNGNFYLEANELLLAVIPFSKNGFVVAPNDDYLKNGSTEAQKFFKDYSLLVFPGQVSGYIVETAEKSKFKNLDGFIQSIMNRPATDFSSLDKNPEIRYRSLSGEELRMRYQSVGLRCRAWINGREQRWDRFTNGAVYESPYLKIRDGVMLVSDGNKSYQVDFRGNVPVYQELGDVSGTN